MENSKSTKEQFFSKISHDLRGSFTSILGFSDILNDPDESLTNEEVNEFVKRIGVQTKESFDLLVNFINWLKIDSFGYGLTKEKIDLIDTLLNIQSLNRKGIAEKNIKVVNKHSDSIFVSMDFEILHSIINNTFSYLISVAAEDSSIDVYPANGTENLSGVRFIARINNQNLTYLNNIEEANSNTPYTILFASKICLLSGGSFNVSTEGNKEITITVLLPKFESK